MKYKYIYIGKDGNMYKTERISRKLFNEFKDKQAMDIVDVENAKLLVGFNLDKKNPKKVQLKWKDILEEKEDKN